MRLRVEGLSVTYGARKVLRDVDIAVSAGQFVAVIGPNGAGKSSLLRGILGLVPATGSVRVDDVETRSMPQDEIARRISYMPQDTSVRSALTVLEVILLGRLGHLGWHLPSHEVEAAVATLDRLHLAHLSSRMIGNLSGGQRQLVFLAQALARNPGLLLLDEPTSALDLKHQLDVLHSLRTLAAPGGPAIVAVMHDLNLAARFADKLIVLSNGTVHVIDTPSAVLTRTMLADVFDVEAEIASTMTSGSIVVPIRARPTSSPL